MRRYKHVARKRYENTSKIFKWMDVIDGCEERNQPTRLNDVLLPSVTLKSTDLLRVVSVPT